MKNLTKIIFTIFMLNVVACGNPMHFQKDLENEERRRKDADAQANALSEENRNLKRYLQNFHVTDHYVWSGATGPLDYEAAVKHCTNIGYLVPDRAAMDELEAQIMDDYPDLKKITGKFHILGETLAAKDFFVICQFARK